MDKPDQSAVSVVALEISIGQEKEFLRVAGQLQNLIHTKGYGADQLLRDGADPRRYYDIRTWKSGGAATLCHADPDVQTLWAKLQRTVKLTQLVDVAWAVEVGLIAAGPWQERRNVQDRRATLARRVQDAGRPEGERRASFDRRIGSRRIDEQSSPNIVLAARHARALAHAPSSGVKVGAALETGHGIIVTGCNIENASDGLMMCAERVALYKAMSEGHRLFRRMAIVSDTPQAPCGTCRQVLWEFGGDLELILGDLREVRSRHRLRELFPQPMPKP